VSAVAVFVAPRLTEGFLPGVGVAVALAVVLDVPWWVVNRYSGRAGETE
jgi:tRNA A37 threonylcarbamoyltransferase TsaD